MKTYLNERVYHWDKKAPVMVWRLAHAKMGLSAIWLVPLGILFLSGCAKYGKPYTGIDFATRCKAPEVVRCFGFDSQELTDPHIYPPSGKKIKKGKVVTDHKVSGAGSLRFEIPPNSPADTSGSFRLNFSDDLSKQFGEGDEFFVQWRQRISRQMLETHYAGGGGWKSIIIGEGDRPGHVAMSCTQLGIVITNPYYRGYPMMYHSCGGKDGQYQKIGEGGKYYADEWMTFQIRIQIGTWYKNDRDYHGDSSVQLWAAREGEESELVIDLNADPLTIFGLEIPGVSTGYDIANTHPDAKYGKVWLLPYNTHKDYRVTYPVAYVWYDDLIISTKKIPDPS